ncbi:MAG: hypothetical protein Q4G66_03930 [bacterium]|nr:hypothetical protein [bacterium]
MKSRFCTGIRTGIRLAVCIVICMLHATEARMEARAESRVQTQTPAEARALIRSVVLQQSRPQSKIEYQWVRRNEKPAPQEEAPGWLENFFKQLGKALGSLDGLRQLAADIGRSGILLALAGGLILYLIYSKRHWLPAFRPGRSPASLKPDILFGLDLRPESLPDLPDQASLALFAAGKPREALALLYRATLSRFIHLHQVQLHPSLTELECQERIDRQGRTAESAYFKRLTLCWLRVAYGHELLDEVLHLELVQGWKECFG